MTLLFLPLLFQPLQHLLLFLTDELLPQPFHLLLREDLDVVPRRPLPRRLPRLDIVEVGLAAPFGRRLHPHLAGEVCNFRTVLFFVNWNPARPTRCSGHARVHHTVPLDPVFTFYPFAKFLGSSDSSIIGHSRTCSTFHIPLNPQSTIKSTSTSTIPQSPSFISCFDEAG